MSVFAERDRALATVLQFCRSYVPDQPTKRVRYRPGVAPPEVNARPPLSVQVVDADALDVALTLEDPCVLILAAGAGMQEESLFRRTALFAHLVPAHYPIGDDEALYARAVPVLLSSEADGYRPLQVTASFVACPGVRMPHLTADGRLSREDEARVRRKVRLVLQIARDEGHPSLVLGALGCGVWGCPSRHLAQIFREELHRSCETAGGGPAVVKIAVLGAMSRIFKDAFE